MGYMEYSPSWEVNISSARHKISPNFINLWVSFPHAQKTVCFPVLRQINKSKLSQPNLLIALCTHCTTSCGGVVLGSWTCWGTRKWDRRRSRKGGSVLKFIGPEPALGVCRQDVRRRIKRWSVNQYWVWWWGLGNTQRQARKLISGHRLGAKSRVLSFNRTQSRALTGLLIGHNTLRRHLHLMGLSDSPLCRRCGAKDETSAHILCECEALASLRQVHLGSLFLEPQYIKSIILGAVWNFSKATGLPWIDMGRKGPVS